MTRYPLVNGRCTRGIVAVLGAAVLGIAGLAAGCRSGEPGGVATAGARATDGADLKGLEDRGEFVVAGIPAIRPEVRDRMLQYLNVRSASVLDTNDDGGPLKELLITTRFGNAAQLHVVRMPGGDRRQITFYDEPVNRARFVPGSGGRRVIMLRDVGGSEDTQVYHLDVSAGRATMLTEGKGQHGNPALSRDGSKLAFYGTARNGKDYDIYLCDLRGDMKPRMIHQGTGSIAPLEFSPDGFGLLLQEYISNKVSHLHLLDVASGDLRPITPRDEETVHADGRFSADGRYVFYTCDRGGEFLALYRRELATGREEAITANLPWDIDDVDVSPTGNAIIFNANVDGASKLYRLESPDSLSYAPIDLPLDGLLAAGFNRAGTHLLLNYTSATSPGDVYTLPVPELASPRSVTRWTESEVGGLDPARFVAPTRISYPTFDEVDGRARMIPAYYFRPRGPGPHPVVISIHGGPEAQFRPAFSGFWQYVVNELNIAVVAPNVRGSTGYGRTYHMLDDGMKREDSVRDIAGLLSWIALQPELGAQRVAVFGGSYGGYMVLACMTHFPDRIKAGVDIVGIANFVTFLERTRDYRRDLRRREYGDEQDPRMREFLARISPLTNADRIRGALFVLHGQNDPRVPLYEAEQIVRRQQQRGRPVWYYMAKGEGHGFQKRSNSDLAQVLYAMFLEEHLLK